MSDPVVIVESEQVVVVPTAGAQGAQGPTGDPTEGIVLDGPPDRLFEFVDALRRVVAYIDTFNTFAIARVRATVTYFVGTRGRQIADSPDPDLFMAVTDPEGRHYFEVRKSGSRAKCFQTDKLVADTINGLPTASYLTLLKAAPAIVDGTTREIVVANGQSLSLGTASTDPGDGSNPSVVVTTDQPYGNLMPESGVRPFVSADPTPFGSLIAHVEAVDAPNSMGETVLGGFQAMLMQLFNRCGYPLPDNPLRTVSFSTGQGETALAAFRQGDGSGLFNRITTGVTAVAGLLGGQVVKMRSHLWLQGESDAATAQATYTAGLVGLAGEVDVAVRGITGQADPVVTLSYQIDRPKIALAQQDAARAARLVQIAAPIYWVEWAGLRGINFDNIHRAAEGYKRLGACFAVAWFCTHILKRPWRPLQLALDARGRLDCRVDGADLLVRYDVPHGGALALDYVTQVDNTLAAAPVNLQARQQGFYLFAADGVTEKPLRDVIIEGRDVVRLVGANAVATDILRVGFTDPTGTAAASVLVNLRDRQGDVITFDDLGGLPVHNWAVAETHQLTAEELA